MKKLIFFFSGLLCCIIADAQLKPPTQEEVLFVRSVKYKNEQVLPENWPYEEIRMSPTYFKFASQVFNIVSAKKDGDYLSFVVKEQNKDNIEYGLSYKQINFSRIIHFSGYSFLCVSDRSIEEVVIEEEFIEEEVIPFQLVEEKPSFKGGDANEFSKWVNERLVYPEIAKDNGAQGRVTLQFTVEKDGSVTNIKVLRGVDPFLDAEAVRVVSWSPKWSPGKQRNRCVPVTYTFPVIFQFK